MTHAQQDAVQRTSALAVGNFRRFARARIRREIAAGASLADVLADPPAAIHDVNLADMIRWRRGWGPAYVAAIGRRALADNVNLLVTVGNAPARTLRWVAGRDIETDRYVTDDVRGRSAA